MSVWSRHVTDAEFEEKVLNAEGPVLVDFWADWCGPCKAIAPALEEIAGEMSDSLSVAKLKGRGLEPLDAGEVRHSAGFRR